jgi:mono/diheme cytochrome c family protein
MTENKTDGPDYFPLIYKSVLGIIMAGAFVVPLGFVAMPYLEFFNGMGVQRKAKAQSHYGHMFGEQIIAARLPVEGTLPRGFFGHPESLAGNEQEQVDLAGEILVNPSEITMENLQRGQKIYNTFCIACHGSKGEGDGKVVGPDRFPAPTSLHDTTIRGYADGSIYQVISNGKGTMLGYADKIEQVDRWAVVNYVRVLQRSLDPKPEDF